MVFLHRLLLEVYPASSNVCGPSAERAGAAPAGPAEAYERESIHVVWRDVFPALFVAAEEFVRGGVVHLALLHQAENFWGKVVLNLLAVDVDLPDAASWGPSLAVLAGVAYYFGEAVIAVAVATRWCLVG